MADKIFHKLNKQNNNYFITNRIGFNPIGKIPDDLVIKAFEFAYQMTFGKTGEHRAYRSGGTHLRKNGEIFANAFQGKLAEFALFIVLSDNHIPVNEPDVNVFGLGTWDSVDLMIKNTNVSIKSTKSFGNLLLLEEKDWDKDAKYIPNDKGYDFTFLIRMNPYCEDILKRNKLLYSDDVSMETLRNIIMSEIWNFDIPGYITRDDLRNIIENAYIIPQGAMLNGKMRMDASNFYIQAGDMRSMEDFIKKMQ